jgi:DNA (cytosine-5)-methyltransferase 1
LRQNCGGLEVANGEIQDQIKWRIRKLTPKECWRLMGFDDADFKKAEKVNSNTQLYKQAGNSIVVNVLEAILEELLHGSAD